MNVHEWISGPLPWYVAGPLMGLTVPLLHVLGNKSLGISSSMRTICAASIPARIPYFSYRWKNEGWNLVFVLGVTLGGTLTFLFMRTEQPMDLHPAMTTMLDSYGVTHFEGLFPEQLFNWKTLFSLNGLVLVGGGGFLVGFGSRYAGGCTSGHALAGLINLQWPSLIATACFFAGGCVATFYLLPALLTK